MCLAQGHNAVTPVRLESAAPRSRVKHYTTEPLRSLLNMPTILVTKVMWEPAASESPIVQIGGRRI